MGLWGLVGGVAHGEVESLITGLGVAGAIRVIIDGLVGDKGLGVTGAIRVIVDDLVGVNGLVGGMVHAGVVGNLTTEVVGSLAAELIGNLAAEVAESLTTGQESLASGRNCVVGESLVVDVSCVDGNRGSKLGKERLTHGSNFVVGEILAVDST